MSPSKRSRLVPLIIAAVIAFVTVPALPGSPLSQKEREVELTFAFFGCNRIEAKDWEEVRTENPSSANLPQLRQNIADVAKLAPNLLFFGGDLVMGYADDPGDTLRSQMSAWIDVVKTLPRASRTQYVALTGNHELNRKVGDRKLPNPITDGVWTTLVKGADLVPSDAKGPTPQTSAADHLVHDQSALSFSFDRGSVHFVVLNTDTRVTTKDPETGHTKIGMIPVHWLNADLDAAEKNVRVKCVVVMGHRNLIDPESVKGDAPIDSECAVPMLKSLKAHAKVRAYVCAHVHAFDISKLDKSGLRQVTFGNGGSKLEKGWDPARGRTFGFGYFKVYKDGSLGVIPYLRPEPKNYRDTRPDQVPPAQPEPELVIPVRKAEAAE